MIKLISILIIILSLPQCDNNKPNQNIELAFGDVYYHNNYDLSLEIDSIADSRCPEGAHCIWAGNAEIMFKMRYENQQYIFSLNSNTTPADTLINDINIKLLKVSPYPKLNEIIKQKDYKVELLIEPNGQI